MEAQLIVLFRGVRSPKPGKPIYSLMCNMSDLYLFIIAKHISWRQPSIISPNQMSTYHPNIVDSIGTHQDKPGPIFFSLTQAVPDSKVHGPNIRPIWVLSTPDGPHVGPMNLAIRGACLSRDRIWPLTYSTQKRLEANNSLRNQRQRISRNIHTAQALPCFVLFWYWLISPISSFRESHCPYENHMVVLVYCQL